MRYFGGIPVLASFFDLTTSSVSDVVPGIESRSTPLERAELSFGISSRSTRKVIDVAIAVSQRLQMNSISLADLSVDRRPCPPSSIAIDGWTTELSMTQLGRNSVITTFVSTKGDLFLKVLNNQGVSQADFERFHQEKVVLATITELVPREDREGIPHVYSVASLNDVSDVCKYRMELTSSIGSISMDKLLDADPLPEPTIAFVGAKLLESLKQLHAMGLVHGFVDAENIVLDDETNPTTVTLVNYYFSVPSADVVESHHSDVREDDKAELVRSVYEFEKPLQQMTRRVDLNRVAETLMIFVNQIYVVSHFVDSEGTEEVLTGEDLHNAKMSLELPERHHGVFNEFFQATKNLGFSETIDYDYWIARFFGLSRGSGRTSVEASVDSSDDEDDGDATLHGAGQKLLVPVSGGGGEKTEEIALISLQRPVFHRSSHSMPSRAFETGTVKRELSGASDSGFSLDKRESFQSAFEMANRISRALSIDHMRMYLKTFIGKCPVEQISIDDGSGLVVIDTSRGSDKEGTGTRVYFASTIPATIGTMAVKILTRNSFTVYDWLRRERAILEVLNGLNGGVVRSHSVDSISVRGEIGFMQPACRAMTLITDFAGSVTLDLLRTNKRQLARAIARAIEILRDLHNSGLVHGDIHVGNIVMEDSTSIETSMRLIDFGRSELYVVRSSKQTPDGASIVWKHRREEIVERSRHFAPLLLSTFELENYPATRRDDLMRLAQTIAFQLIEKSVFDEIRSLTKNIPRLIQAKKLLDIPGHALVNEFYKEMVNLKFRERPDYEKWIAKFREHRRVDRL